MAEESNPTPENLDEEGSTVEFTDADKQALLKRQSMYDKMMSEPSFIAVWTNRMDKLFRLYRGTDATERLYEVTPKQEAILQLNYSRFCQSLHDEFAKVPGAPSSPRSLDQFTEIWKLNTNLLSNEPEPFCFLGDDRLCLKRFDWKPEPGEFSAWKEFLDRQSDPDAFMAFVWSAFELKNQSRQFLWLRGEGEDGKSRIFGVLRDVFGTAGTGISNSHLQKENRFLYSTLHGKRAIFYADCKNTKLPMGEFVRNVTSGDDVLIEFKGQQPFSARMYLKLFVASNQKPDISGQAADRSRILWIEVTASKVKDDPTWSAKLTAQLPAFLWACQQKYEAVCPNHGNISVNDATKAKTIEAAKQFEEVHEVRFERLFEAVPGFELSASKFLAALENGLDRRMSGMEIADFKAWMQRERAIKCLRKNAGNVYVGIKLKGYMGSASVHPLSGTDPLPM